MERIKILKPILLAGLLFALLVFAGSCVSPEGGAEEGFDWSILIFIALIFGVFYFLIIRPQRKRQKDHDQLMQELRKGDNVITTGGIYGVVESLSDESIVLKIESGATIRIARESVSSHRQK
jgi:preprotein translocase subunit YajC